MPAAAVAYPRFQTTASDVSKSYEGEGLLLVWRVVGGASGDLVR
jgi:hypothetical protein